MILLDTHAVLWLADQTDRLSPAAVEAIKDARSDGGLAISPATLFEIGHATARGRIQLATPLEIFLDELAKRFVVKPIHAAIAIAAARFTEPYPKDPMDRLIGATALVEGIPLVTADDRIRFAGQIQTIW